MSVSNLGTSFISPSITYAGRTPFYSDGGGSNAPTVSTFQQLFTSSITGNTAKFSTINGSVFPSPGISTFQQLYTSSIVGNTALFSTINGAAFPSPTISTFQQLYTSSIAGATAGFSTINTSSITGISSINAIQLTDHDITNVGAIQIQDSITLDSAGTISLATSTGDPGQYIGIPLGGTYPQWVTAVPGEGVTSLDGLAGPLSIISTDGSISVSTDVDAGTLDFKANNIGGIFTAVPGYSDCYYELPPIAGLDTNAVVLCTLTSPDGDTKNWIVFSNVVDSFDGGTFYIHVEFYTGVISATTAVAWQLVLPTCTPGTSTGVLPP